MEVFFSLLVLWDLAVDLCMGCGMVILVAFPLLYCLIWEEGLLSICGLDNHGSPSYPILSISGGGINIILWFGYFGGMFNINMNHLELFQMHYVSS
jgi:hypothetical protein